MDTQPRRSPYTIGTVDILSAGEQIAYVTTPSGGYIVGRIPDATVDTAADCPILAKADTLQEAQAWFRQHYGL